MGTNNDVTIRIGSTDGNKQCFDQIILSSSRRKKVLAKLNITTSGTVSISDSLINFCHNSQLTASFIDSRQKRGQITKTRINLLELEKDEDRVILRPVNENIIKDCGNIFYVSLFCKTPESGKTYQLSRYFYLYKDISSHLFPEIKNDKLCSLSDTKAATWIQIDGSGNDEMEKKNPASLISGNSIECYQSYHVIGIIVVVLSLIMLFSLLVLSCKLKSSFFVPKVMSMRTRDTLSQQEKSSTQANKLSIPPEKQPAINPAFDADGILERTLSWDGTEGSSASVRKRGSGSASNFIHDYHIGD